MPQSSDADDIEDLGPTETGIVWHYTDAGGLLGMLSNNVLWATSYSHLNDGAEIQTGIQVLDEAADELQLTATQSWYVARQIRRAKEDLERAHVFMLSASTEPDSLSQWRAYGGGSGFAVGLDASKALDVLSAPGYATSEYSPDQPDFGEVFQHVSPWREVIYDDAEQRRRARLFIKEMAKFAPTEGTAEPAEGHALLNDALGTLLYGRGGYEALAILMKDSGFKDEHEVRLYATIQNSPRFQQTRVSRFGLTPYVRLTGSSQRIGQDDRAFAAKEARPVPIVEIRIGPTPYVDSARTGLEATLRQFGREDVTVSASEVPYR